MNLRLSAFLILLPAGAAFAASTTADLAVSAKVLSGLSCGVVAHALNFGEITAGQPNFGTSNSIVVTCSDGQPYRVALNAGEHYDADSGTRQMVSGGDGVGYALYLGGVEWGDGDSYPAGQPVSGVGYSKGTAFNVTAKVFTNAQTPAGDYADTVLVTVHY